MGKAVVLVGVIESAPHKHSLAMPAMSRHGHQVGRDGQVDPKTPDWASFDDLPSQFDTLDVEAFLNARSAGGYSSESKETQELAVALEALRSLCIHTWLGFEQAWTEYGIRFIAEDSLVDYAKALAAEEGYNADQEAWPRQYVDWVKAAKKLRADLSLIETTLGERVYLWPRDY